MAELKDIRKSAFITYRQCNRRFDYLYKDPHYWDYGTDKTLPPDDPRQLGNEFHDACDKWYDKMRGATITKNFTRTFNNPFNVEQPPLFEWFNWFMETETQRWIDLEEHGKSGLWYPLACELEVQYKAPGAKVGMTGHIDRIDVLEDNTIQIVEYKAGKSYDMTNKYALSNMNQEIGFYAVLLRDSKAFPDREIKTWKVINPKLGKVWVNRISPISTRAVERTMSEIADKVSNGSTKDFDKNISVLCNWCPYVEECLYGDSIL